MGLRWMLSPSAVFRVIKSIRMHGHAIYKFIIDSDLGQGQARSTMEHDRV